MYNLRNKQAWKERHQGNNTPIAREEVQYNGHCMIKHDRDVGNNATCLHHSTCCK